MQPVRTEVSAGFEPKVMDTPLVQEMAEQIRSLKGKVEQLELERRERDVATPTLSRTPSAEHGLKLGPLLQETAPPEARPMTPRSAAAGTPRRTREVSSERRTATPPRRATPPPARSSLTRSSSEVQLDRDSSASQPLRHQGAAANEDGTGFRVEAPRQTKQARQLREKAQRWGPDQISAEHVTALRECWRPCVDDRLCQEMFSEKMEEQLHALQTWKLNALKHLSSLEEVMDMVLKWLTWTLTNPNTQIWKLTLDILNGLLHGMATSEYQLTDREAQILIPNIVERSGHNLACRWSTPARS